MIFPWVEVIAYFVGFASGFLIAAWAVWKGNKKAIASRMIKLNGQIFFLDEVR